MAYGLIINGEYKAAVNERLLITVFVLLSEYKGGDGVASRILDLIKFSDSVPPGALAVSADWTAGMLGLHPKELPAFLSKFLEQANVTKCSLHKIESRVAVEAASPVYESAGRLQRVYRTRNLDEPEVRDRWRLGL